MSALVIVAAFCAGALAAVGAWGFGDKRPAFGAFNFLMAGLGLIVAIANAGVCR